LFVIQQQFNFLYDKYYYISTTQRGKPVQLLVCYSSSNCLIYIIQLLNVAPNSRQTEDSNSIDWHLTPRTRPQLLTVTQQWSEYMHSCAYRTQPKRLPNIYGETRDSSRTQQGTHTAKVKVKAVRVRKRTGSDCHSCVLGSNFSTVSTGICWLPNPPRTTRTSLQPAVTNIQLCNGLHWASKHSQLHRGLIRHISTEICERFFLVLCTLLSPCETP